MQNILIYNIKKNFDKKIKKTFKNKMLKGLNITIPFKKQIIKHIDNLDKHSKDINAVNSVTNSKNVKEAPTPTGYYYKLNT